jgi:hypothetical protein
MIGYYYYYYYYYYILLLSYKLHRIWPSGNDLNSLCDVRFYSRSFLSIKVLTSLLLPSIFFSFQLTLSCIIKYVFCLATGPEPLPKRALHRVRSNVSYFKFQYFFPLRKSSSLRILPLSSSLL